MQQYPYYSPLVLTDSVFIQFGGRTGTSTLAQRQAAYLLAEEQMTEHLNAFLVPTVVTGTYMWNGGNPFQTDYGYILQVKQVTISDLNFYNSCQVNTASGCAIIRDAVDGYIDLHRALTCGGYNLSYLGFAPYSVQVVYESGLSSGTVTQPSMLAALTIAAQINLNEWDVSLSNEGVGDIGIQNFSNQGYSETRVKLGKNTFGSSALSQRAARLVRKYRARAGLSFHR